MTMNTNSEEDFQDFSFWLWKRFELLESLTSHLVSKPNKQTHVLFVKWSWTLFSSWQKNALKNSQRVATILIIITSDVN